VIKTFTTAAAALTVAALAACAPTHAGPLAIRVTGVSWSSTSVGQQLPGHPTCGQVKPSAYIGPCGNIVISTLITGFDAYKGLPAGYKTGSGTLVGTVDTSWVETCLDGREVKGSATNSLSHVYSAPSNDVGFAARGTNMSQPVLIATRIIPEDKCGTSGRLTHVFASNIKLKLVSKTFPLSTATYPGPYIP
jgi:hypothetical protein